MKKVTQQPLDQMFKGISTLASAVGSTLGPKGNNVAIEIKYGATKVTKDGVTVAQHIELEDPIENLGVSIVKQATEKTAHKVGDGTTTATILTYALIKEMMPYIKTGTAPITAVKTMEKMLPKVISLINKNTKKVEAEEIARIATISANNDSEIGSLIAEAYSEVGKEGILTLEESKSSFTYLDVTKGVRIDRGYLSRYFINDVEKEQVVLENPYIFVTNSKVRSIQEMMPLFQKCIQTSRPLVLIADEVEGQVLQAMAINAQAGNFKCVAIKAPSFGDQRADFLGDLAIVTGAKLYDPRVSKFEEATLQDLGQASKVTVAKDETIILEPKGNKEDIQLRIKTITNLFAENEGNDYVTEKLYERIALLSAQVARIFVGAATETALKEKKDRIDDAIKASRAAIVGGYVRGGGTIFNEMSFEVGLTPLEEAFTRSLSYPLRQIIANAGQSPEVIMSKLSGKLGYDALNNDIVDMEEAGIIDPSLVLIESITNAVSASSMILLSSNAVTFIDRSPAYHPNESFNQ